MNIPDNQKRVPAPVFDIFNVYFDSIYEPTMHIVFEFKGKIDEKRLKTAVCRVIESDPYMMSFFSVENKTAFWEKESCPNIKDAFYLYDATGRTDYLEKPPQKVDVYKGPQLRAGIYRMYDCDSVVISCHHGFSDAGGLKGIASDIFLTYNKLGEDPNHMPEQKGWYYRGTQSIIESFSKSTIEDALKSEEPFTDNWAFPFEYIGRGEPRISVRKLSFQRMRQIKKFTKKYGATVNDVFIGAFFLALLKINPCKSDEILQKSILTSADVRKYYGREKEAHPQNLSVAYEISLIADENCRLDDIISRIVAITKDKKSGDMGLGCIAFYEQIFSGGIESIMDFFRSITETYGNTNLKNPVFSNIGIIESDCFSAKEDLPEIENAYFLPVICWPPGFLMTVSTFKGAMTIASGYEEGPYSGRTVEKFLEYVDYYLP